MKKLMIEIMMITPKGSPQIVVTLLMVAQGLARNMTSMVEEFLS